MNKDLEKRIIKSIKKVFDPEIPVNIYELGLIYKIDSKDGENIDITMTLTSPFCPVAGSLPKEVAARAEEVEGVKKANVELVFEPPWSMDLMSDEAKLKLNLTENFSI
ncbi:MAG: SUF system Fe-S cluster assembly protein [Candidatus Poseidoniales archaeon]